MPTANAGRIQLCTTCQPWACAFSEGDHCGSGLTSPGSFDGQAVEKPAKGSAAWVPPADCCTTATALDDSRTELSNRSRTLNRFHPAATLGTARIASGSHRIGDSWAWSYRCWFRGLPQNVSIQHRVM